MYSRGAVALLQRMHCVVSKIHQECLQAFTMMTVDSEGPFTATEEALMVSTVLMTV